MILIDEIHKAFGDTNVLRGVSLYVNRGEITALIGKSGQGKSVLLKHVSGLIKPDQGQVLIDGQNISPLKGRDLLNFRSRLGFLFQNGALFDSMTVFDNVAFPLREKKKMGEKEIQDRVAYELNLVGLLESRDKYPSQISGGMIKRVSIARALIEEPEIMLFDEPTTGLDPITGQTILTLIKDCHSRVRFTGIIVTHEIPKIFQIVDKVALLSEGEIIFKGTPEEIIQTKDPAVHPFIKGAGMDPGDRDVPPERAVRRELGAFEGISKG